MIGLTGDVGGPVGGQEEDERGHLFGASQAAHGDFPAPLFHHGRVVARGFGHGGDDDARTDGVDAYAVFGQLTGRLLCEPHDGRFAGRVGTPVVEGDGLARDAAHVDDDAVPLPDHDAGRGLSPQEDPPRVHGHDPIPHLHRHLQNGGVGFDARVVHHHVHAAPLPDGRLNELPDRVGVGDVPHVEEGLSPALADGVHGGPGFLRYDVVDRDAHALIRGGQGNGPPDPLTASGDHEYPVLEFGIQGHHSLLPVKDSSSGTGDGPHACAGHLLRPSLHHLLHGEGVRMCQVRLRGFPPRPDHLVDVVEVGEGEILERGDVDVVQLDGGIRGRDVQVVQEGLDDEGVQDPLEDVDDAVDGLAGFATVPHVDDVEGGGALFHGDARGDRGDDSPVDELEAVVFDGWVNAGDGGAGHDGVHQRGLRVLAEEVEATRAQVHGRHVAGKAQVPKGAHARGKVLLDEVADAVPGEEAVRTDEETPGDGEGVSRVDDVPPGPMPERGEFVHVGFGAVGRDVRGVDGPGRGADDEVGTNAVAEENVQRADLQGPSVSAAAEDDGCSGHEDLSFPTFGFACPPRRPIRVLHVGGDGEGEYDGAPRVEDAGADALVDLVDGFGGGDDGGQVGVVAEVEELVEFFPSPGGGAFRAQVVQDEEGGALDFLETPVVGDGAFGVEGAPQVVQQVGDDDEEDVVATSGPFVGDGRGQVGFPRAVGSGEDEPVPRAFRVG